MRAVTALAKLFAKELQAELNAEHGLAAEFFATKEYPDDDVAALRAWVQSRIDDCLCESEAVNRFLKLALFERDVTRWLRAPKGLK